MANLRLPLTDAICKLARPEEREYALRDTRQPGLCLRVQPSGARGWIMRLRVDGAQVKHSLGSFPEMGVKPARKAAAAILSGEMQAPSRSPAPIPVFPLFTNFQTEHEKLQTQLLKPSGLTAYRSYVRTQLLPAFGNKRLDAISRRDVVVWFESYSATSPGGANRALGILGQMLTTAISWGHLPSDWTNPVTGIRHNRRKVVGTFLSETQMTRLGAALAVRIKRGCMVSQLLRFLTLSGCRVGEAINLEWRDVLPDRLSLRDSKTGPRDVVLGAPVLRFLKSQRGRAERSRSALNPDRVFPLIDGKEYEAVRSVWFSVRWEADLPPKLRIHDLRHSFASHSVMSGETLLTTSRLLGHRRIQTTARYAHLADDALLKAAERIGALIMAEVAG